MQALLKFSRAIDWLNGKIGQYAIWLIFGATAISAINAVIRKAFNYSSNGFLEVQWYLFAWSFLIAAGFTLLKREHVRIDVLNSHFPKKLQLAVEIFGLLFFLTPVPGRAVLRHAADPADDQDGRDIGQPRWPDPLARLAGLAAGLFAAAAAGLVGADQGPRLPGRSGAGPHGNPTHKSDEAALIEALRNEAAQAASAQNP